LEKYIRKENIWIFMENYEPPQLREQDDEESESSRQGGSEDLEAYYEHIRHLRALEDDTERQHSQGGPGSRDYS
jgi:hypothetical protein